MGGRYGGLGRQPSAGASSGSAPTLEMERGPGGTWRLAPLEMPIGKPPEIAVSKAAEAARSAVKGSLKMSLAEFARSQVPAPGLRATASMLARHGLLANGPWANVQSHEDICGDRSQSQTFRCVATGMDQCGLGQPDLGDFVGSPSECKNPPAGAVQGYGEVYNPQNWRRIVWAAHIRVGARPLYEQPLSGMYCYPNPALEVPPKPERRPRFWEQTIFGPDAGVGAEYGAPDAPHQPPTPGDREKKPNTAANRVRTRLYPKIGALTEAKDLVECIWESLPKDCKTKSPTLKYFDKNKHKWVTKVKKNEKGVPIRPDPGEQARDIYKCFGRLNMSDMTTACSIALLKDAAFGTLSAGIQRQSQRHMKCRPVGLGAGPAM